MEYIKVLSNEALTKELRQRLSTERQAVAEFLDFLNEYDLRRAYEVDGYPSLFKYLVDGFCLSEPTAAKRIASMRLLRKWPQVRSLIKSGAIHLTGLYAVSKYLTDANYLEVLKLCSGKSKSWIEGYLLREFQAKATHALRDSVKPIRLASAEAKPRNDHKIAKSAEDNGVGLTSIFPSAINSEKEVTSNSEVRQSNALYTNAHSQPKAIRISTALEAEAFEDLKRAQEILGAKDFGDVIAKALKNYLRKIDPKRKPLRAAKAGLSRMKQASAKKSKPVANRNGEQSTTQTGGARKQSRYEPVAEKVKVHHRDNNRCTYVSPNGLQCQETTALQLDHCFPFALGGKNTAENLRLLCGPHNRMRARNDLGEKFIVKKITERNKCETATFSPV